VKQARPGFTDWQFNGQFRKIWPFLTALAVKKRIWPFCKIWPFFWFVTVKLSFHFILPFLYILDGIHVTHCYSNTVALIPFIALKCVIMI